MLKIKSILVSLLVVAALASCSNENLEENPEVEGGAGYDVAYVSISLTNPKVPGSRASGEQTALEEESAINELYLITFNASKVARCELHRYCAVDFVFHRRSDYHPD